MSGPSRTGPPAVSFVIPVRNGAADLPRCLTSIRANAAASGAVEVVVVDNGSTDGSADVARRLGAKVVERPGIRVGGCRNEGAAASSGAILAFVDADNEIGSGWLRACASAFQDARIGAAGYPYRSPDAATWVQRMYDALRTRTGARGDIEWLGAGNLAVRRSVFEQVGGFDEGLEACEDVELCQAVRRAGYRVLGEPGMDSVHHGDPRTLSALFFGELWRGRDNLRVSLRGPLALRTVPGALLPVVGLVCLAAGGLGLAAWPWIGGRLAAVGGLGLLAIAVLKTLVIVIRGRLSAPPSWVQAFAVAATYETARALSLVSSASHRTRLRVARHA